MSGIADLMSAWLTPSGAVTVLFTLGALTALARRASLSWWLLTGACCTFVLFSSGPVAALLMRPLEYRYPTLQDPRAFPAAEYIVALTAAGTDDLDLPLTRRVNDSTAYRLLMALELFQQRPDCTVVVTGDAVTARLMAEILRKLGVPDAQLIIEPRSRNTAETAVNLKAIVGARPFFAVTSAGHLPRTIGAMHAQGLKPIPVPTDHKLPKNWTRAEIRPSPGSLAASDLAVHEYLGDLWYRLTGRI